MAIKRNGDESATTNVVDKNNVLQVKISDNKKEVDFYLINVIEDVADYIDFLREVENCEDGDSVTVHINCYGGSVDVGLNLYDALVQSKADIQISIEGACCSCASMIMLAGNYWKVAPHSYVMVHAWTEGYYGKWNELQSKFSYDLTIVENQFRELYKNFLTDDEIEECIKGKDFYFDCEETVKRLDKYMEKDYERENAIQKIGEKYSKLAEKEINAYLKKINKKK